MSDPVSTSGDLTGRKIGQYEIGEQLGQGGMATVYKAVQSSIGRVVAIKVMPTYFMGDPNFLQRFEREVKVIAELQHPRVLPVYDYGQDQGRPYIVMAYMPGGTLADLIRKGPMPLEATVRLVEQIAEGLDHAHNHGIIHRDFKPSNVLLDANGNAYLADFGIAKMTESTVQLTGSGIVGTPAYMAPEMAEHGDVTPSIDIYALGITLYQMLTGKYPFEGETPIRVMMAHTQDPIPNVREARPDLPMPVAEVVRKAMAKKPADRYPTAGALASALRAASRTAGAALSADDDGGTMVAMAAPVLTPTPVPAPQSAPPAQVAPPEVIHTPTPPPPAPSKRRMPTWLIIVGAVGVLALGVCLCLVIGPMLSGGGSTKSNLIIDNQSGTTVCKVDLAISGSNTRPVEQLGGNQIATGTTFRLTGINPGSYDISAYDCAGSPLAEDKNIQLPTGDFTWTISPSP